MMSLPLIWSGVQKAYSCVESSESETSSTQQQLDDLMEIKQEVKIHTIKLEDLENIQLTSKQMQALLFMIEDE